jgi:glycosyltransferase involved in cell wall biosynthesis
MHCSASHMTSENTEMPLSVLMPAYNAEATIAATITSVINQSFKFFEFVIISDGSTDGTDDIIRSFADERIRFSRNPENMGLVGTLNKGIAQ